MEEMNRPVTQLTTNRGLLKFILYSIITLGIYQIVVYTKVSHEINLVGKSDGRHTMNYLLVLFVFSWLTLGIVPLVWWTKLCARIGENLAARNIPYSFGAGTYWGWNIFGVLLLYIGPFVFIHKFFKAMNKLNADYNERG